MLRVGVAGIPEAWSTELLRSALRAAGAEAMAFRLADCVADLRTGAVSVAGTDLGTFDGVVVKKLGVSTDPLTPSRVNLLRQLEWRGVRVFSPARAIAQANDRHWMSLRLNQAGIPTPHTLVTENLDEAEEIIARWERVVVKPLFTSKGRGMLLLFSDRAHRLKLRRWRRVWRMPFYLQEYVPHTGRDLSVAVLDGRVLGAYYRVAAPDAWMTTTSSGGHYEACATTPEIARLAVAAASLFGLDFTCVDLVEGPSGYVAYEVSAFGGFAGLWQTHGIDVAGLYAEHIVRTLTSHPRHERIDSDSAHIPA